VRVSVVIRSRRADARFNAGSRAEFLGERLDPFVDLRRFEGDAKGPRRRKTNLLCCIFTGPPHDGEVTVKRQKAARFRIEEPFPGQLSQLTLRIKLKSDGRVSCVIPRQFQQSIDFFGDDGEEQSRAGRADVVERRLFAECREF